jgi:hypothetical protein
VHGGAAALVKDELATRSMHEGLGEEAPRLAEDDHTAMQVGVTEYGRGSSRQGEQGRRTGLQDASLGVQGVHLPLEGDCTYTADACAYRQSSAHCGWRKEQLTGGSQFLLPGRSFLLTTIACGRCPVLFIKILNVPLSAGSKSQCKGIERIHSSHLIARICGYRQT